MDLFKKANVKQATAWDWNCPKVCKRTKGDTKRLHKLARRRLNEHDREEIRQVFAWKEKIKNRA